ncbi:MarR family winged helix-turn-helix transcriptional regulator [Modestobacter roseus]|uniref:DNA-binding MarR family transcriptional regulator n=1 Tax=Modestobacter roseus TaxID=1181884 RepID=A0A562ILQ7_9ACTN|nr:MarR family transcriptional regulator [Modestobacter roseus]TWH71812.1 DNA-binding MarR family transcriptional regulator [Modestobacter roseus]
MEHPPDGDGPRHRPPGWVAQDPGGIPAYALARAGAAVSDLFARQLARVGLRTHTFFVLVHLSRDRVLTSAELARRLELTPQSMSALLRTLADEGWIERQEEVRRGQRIDVRLTEAGHAALAAAGPLLAELNRPEALGLSATEAATLHGLLERVLAHVSPGHDVGPSAAAGDDGPPA